MGKIFSCASQVIFWLGKPTYEVIMLMNSLSELQTKHIAALKAGKPVDSTSWERSRLVDGECWFWGSQSADMGESGTSEAM